MRPDDLQLVNMYLDGELAREERTALEKRLASDVHLRTYFEEMKRLESATALLDIYPAPEITFPQRPQLLRWSRDHRFGSFIAGVTVAVVCILIGIGIGGGFFHSPSPNIQSEVFRMIYYAPGAHSVSMLGDFNGWSGEIPLKPKGEGGYWLTEIRVEPGEYRYVLKVDGKEQPGDPLADYIIDDDFGSKNSVIRIGL